MVRIDKYQVDVNIAMDKGIYVLGSMSATGKTRLANLFKKYGEVGEPVAAYTYQDKERGIAISDTLVPGKYKAIVLDRYDMYAGDGIREMQECAKSAVVLVDCKNYIDNLEFEDWCDIHMSTEKIEVTV